MKTPLVTIVMPVYNMGVYVEESISSILSQTYKNIEFIILNDGSTDNTASLIGSIRDSRINFIDSNENKGNYFRRNEGCKIASGKYICVMDSDDIALPHRIETQIQRMESDDSILACGSFFKIVGNSSTCFTTPKSYDFIKLSLLKNNVVVHPTLMLNKKILEEVNYYSEEYYYAADYNLICDIARKGKIVNIPEQLLEYRRHEKQISSAHHLKQAQYANLVRVKYLKKLGFCLSEDEERYFTRLMTNAKVSEFEIDGIEMVVSMLKEQNRIYNIFKPVQFNKYIDLLFSKCYLRNHFQVARDGKLSF
ncbi:glycosyltransferase family 2 protein [Sphingobacterium lumbrici]|uniref:glycosyltransferase family 2 protein n=1 Tax=Sphingobacterium lumbrici TaxID=2559600 RepID=UPI0011291A7C|nr:glycosyltransferase family 2 protein [Sphingobacterium lumbrici]